MRLLERSLMPWIVASQTVPIIALAPMIVVILNQFDIGGMTPKAVIAAYLSFFPITVGMVKGLRSPDPLQLDLMRTYSATPSQTLREAARAGEPAVLLRQHEDRRGGGAGRRGRRRSHQERGRRARRAAARRLLLRADRADLGGTVHGRGAVGRAGRDHRPDRPHHAPPHGVPDMNAALADLAPPLLFGLAVLALWEAVVRLLGVPADHPAGALGDRAAARHLGADAGRRFRADDLAACWPAM